MAFGASPGTPATAKQLRELVALLAAAGHDGFRDARGPMGFTQRQANGKFTRDEAAAFIDQLESAAHAAGAAGAEVPDPPRPAAKPARLTSTERAVRDASDEVLAAELQRRGWIVVEP